MDPFQKIIQNFGYQQVKPLRQGTSQHYSAAGENIEVVIRASVPNTNGFSFFQWDREYRQAINERRALQKIKKKRIPELVDIIDINIDHSLRREINQFYQNFDGGLTYPLEITTVYVNIKKFIRGESYPGGIIPRDQAKELYDLITELHSLGVAGFEIQASGNLISGEDGRMYIVDFGLVTFAEDVCSGKFLDVKNRDISCINGQSKGSFPKYTE